MLEIVQIPCLSDNYGFLVHDPQSGQTITIDSPDPVKITDALEKRGWRLSAIWNTHHHYDHAGGNAALRKRWNCKVIAPAGDAPHIELIDRKVGQDDVVRIGKYSAQVIHTPGHTMGHICYYIAEAGMAFVGDALFALGCGRMFEGQASDMWPALQKLMQLPLKTQIYCAHEYTADNLRFALSIDPNNEKLTERGAQITKSRAQGVATIPFTLMEDLQTNPFLRPYDTAIREKLDMMDATDCQVFAEIRRLKDNF